MPKIAIPEWNGRVSPVFDTASELLIVETAGNEPVERRTEPITETLILQRVNRLKELDIDLLLCGSISNPLRRMVEGAGIQVVPWLSGPVEEILTAYLGGSLGNGNFAMPRGRGRGGRRHRGGRGPG